MARASPRAGRGCQAGQEHAVQGDPDQHDQEGRYQPADPVPPEPGQADPGVLPELGDEESGDEEAGEHEEHVDAEEAAAGPREPAVEEEDEDDPQGAHAVERRDPAQSGFGGRGGCASSTAWAVDTAVACPSAAVPTSGS